MSYKPEVNDASFELVTALAAHYPWGMFKLYVYDIADGYDAETKQPKPGARIKHLVSGCDLKAKWLTKLQSTLTDAQEICISSSVNTSGQTLHIPMVDFACKSIGKDAAKHILKKLGDVPLYNSGRSYHCYGTDFSLMTKDQWVAFMGKLLLVNNKYLDLVDTRWVGNRIIAGESALRLTAHTGRHSHAPLFVGTASQLTGDSKAVDYSDCAF